MVHSLITLFPPTATSFDTNGLGSLGEAISCIVTEERNGSFELEMVYPVTGKHYNDIEKRSILYVKPNPVDPPQAFRIYAYTKPMDGLVTYQAEHISYDLAGYPVKAFSASSCSQAFVSLKNSSVISHPFTFWTDKSNAGSIRVTTPTPTRSVLGGSEDSILEIFGGEYKFNNFEVRLYNHRGMNRGVVIRYGKNLIDIKQEESISEVYTDILPYWYGEVDEIPTLVTLPELTIATSTAYNFHRILPLDMSSSFQEKPFVVDLREAANEWIKQNDPSTPTASFEVSFAQLEQTEEYANLALLERVELCDEVTVEYPDFGISATAKVTKTVYDVMSESYSSVTLGDIRQTLSGSVSGQDKSIKEAADTLRNSFKTDLNTTKEGFQSDLDNTKKNLEGLQDDLNTTKDNFQSNLDSTKEGLQKDLNSTKDELTNNLNDAKQEFNDNLSNMEDVLSGNLDKAKEEFNNSLNTAVEDFNNDLNNTKEEFNNSLDSTRQEFQKALDDTKTELEKATDEATNWITNGRGYMVAVKNEIGQWTEICSLNAPDLKNANKVWRWNSGGFGYSAHGYNGPYNLAITQDGRIVADFITTGSMSANIIKGGTLTLGGGSTNNDGSITMLDFTSKHHIADWNSSNGFTTRAYNYNNDNLIGALNLNESSIYFINSKNQVIASTEGSDYSDDGGDSFASCYSITLMPKANNHYGFEVCYGSPGFSPLFSVTDAWTVVSGDLMVSGGIQCIGEKLRIVSTKNYSWRKMYAYETLTPMFGEIGEGTTDEEGICYVYLNDIFSETVNTKKEYQVFIQKQGPGDLWVSEKNELYFVVSGTKNLKFSWEIKAKQLNYEYDEIEKAELNNEKLVQAKAKPTHYELAYDEEIKQKVKSIDNLYIDMIQETEGEYNEAVKQFYGISY